MYRQGQVLRCQSSSTVVRRLPAIFVICPAVSARSLYRATVSLPSAIRMARRYVPWPAAQFPRCGGALRGPTLVRDPELECKWDRRLGARCRCPDVRKLWVIAQWQGVGMCTLHESAQDAASQRGGRMIWIRRKKHSGQPIRIFLRFTLTRTVGHATIRAGFYPN